MGTCRHSSLGSPWHVEKTPPLRRTFLAVRASSPNSCALLLAPGRHPVPCEIWRRPSPACRWTAGRPLPPPHSAPVQPTRIRCRYKLLPAPLRIQICPGNRRPIFAGCPERGGRPLRPPATSRFSAVVFRDHDSQSTG